MHMSHMKAKWVKRIQYSIINDSEPASVYNEWIATWQPRTPVHYKS